MTEPQNPADPDDTAYDLDAEDPDDDPANDLELVGDEDDSDESYVWDAAPADPGESQSGGTRSGSSAGTRSGSSAGSRSGTSAGSRAGSSPGEGGSAAARQAADELGLGWMDDDELRDLSPSMQGLGEEERVRIKMQRQSEIKKQISSAGGQFVIGLLVWLITVAAVILGATNWDNNAYLIPAAVIAPIGLWYSFSRWKRWIGTAPYCYKLMSSLGEDAENLKAEHAMKQMRKATKQMQKHSNR
ncbi:MAG: hypothetical protein ACI89L_001267 [Phycisphaerales bacterium]|jgi:hypothetical protein